MLVSWFCGTTRDSDVDLVSLWLPHNTQHGMLHRVFIEEINQLETQKEVQHLVVPEGGGRMKSQNPASKLHP